MCNTPSILIDTFTEPVPTMNIEWEYMPGYSIRSPNSYVGLKNGGATCYMNSVFQQVSFYFTIIFKSLRIMHYSVNFCVLNLV